MKESYPPGIFKPDELCAIKSVDDDSAYAVARRLAREEGIFVGMSAGAAMKVALDEAQALQKGTVVALLPDGGERYLSTSLFVFETTPEPLHFYNTLSGKLEQLNPVSPGKISMYSCGPSLDGPPDLGLCRRVVFSDVLRRYLECRGHQVKHAMNLGDIDDRTVKECLKAGSNWREFTTRWEKVFFESLATLRVKPAHNYPKASEHVGDMVEQTRSLLEMGLAYEKLRSVYFRIRSFSDYGKLSGIEPERMRSEVSTTYDYYDKDNPGDFALFKRSTLAELKSGIFWQTPWGNARPGWHVECACMAVQCLGQPIDIHTASTDLTFPHGDNEIAIACGLKHKPLANLWMHCEVVMAEGKKVSRAVGNGLTLEHLMEQGFDGPTVRYWLLATHYRTVLHYSIRELQRAAQSVARLNEFVLRLARFQSGRRSVHIGPVLHEVQAAWRDAMDNDLNIPKALGKLFPFVREINRLLDREELDGDQAGQVLDFMRQTNDVLNVIDFRAEEPNAQAAKLIEAREKARQTKDFQTADAIRKELESMGVRVADSPIGAS
jgi:cysteinyl-tRNA synthetase